MEKKFAENDYVQLRTEGNILYSEYKVGLSINLEIAEEILRLYSSICKEEKYLVLQDMKNLIWIDKKSRDLLAAHPITNQMIAWAFHSRKPLHKVMYSIFVTFSNPEVTTEFFTHPDAALRWLKEFIENKDT